MKNVLVIEDDRDITEMLEIHLKDLRCKVAKAHDGEKGLQAALKQRFDLVILDLMLPKIDGLEVCRTLRAEKYYTPILMLTAKSEEFDKVLAVTGYCFISAKSIDEAEKIAKSCPMITSLRIHEAMSM